MRVFDVFQLYKWYQIARSTNMNNPKEQLHLPKAEKVLGTTVHHLIEYFGKINK